MFEAKNGGPAFPCEWDYINSNRDAANGMSMRDYLAAKAMQGLLANPGGPVQQNGMSGWNFTNCDKNDVATLAYVLADAMLAARSK